MSGGGGGGGGGRRKLNCELNLTSYIDLMSTLIIFLLMTAVWNNIDALSTNAANSTASDSADPQTPPPKKVALAISVFEDRVEVSEDQKVQAIANVSGELNIDKVRDELARLKTQYPDREDIVLNTDNKIPYRHMIQVFDLLVGNKWPDVGVNTM